MPLTIELPIDMLFDMELVISLAPVITVPVGSPQYAVARSGIRETYSQGLIRTQVEMPERGPETVTRRIVRESVIQSILRETTDA